MTEKKQTTNKLKQHASSSKNKKMKILYFFLFFFFLDLDLTFIQEKLISSYRGLPVSSSLSILATVLKIVQFHQERRFEILRASVLSRTLCTVFNFADKIET